MGPASRTDLSPADVWSFEALLFDLDGVLTRTALIHAAAWKALFDAFLARWSAEHGVAQPPFDAVTEYLHHVDGRRRYDGVDGFLRSRGIALPWGTPRDPPGQETVCGLGNAKDERFHAQLERQGVETFDDAVALVHAGRRRGKRLAVVSASESCRDVLFRAGLLDLMDATVSGLDAAELTLAGKPAPDTFLEGARRVGVAPERCAVFEDAIAGVQAGRAGGFGIVVGVDRVGHGAELLAAGADLVCADLRALLSP